MCYETLGRGGERKRVLHPCGHAVCDGCFDWWLQNNALARFMRPITIQCPRCLQRATSVQTPPVTDKHPIRLLVDSRLTTAIRAIALTLWCEAARYIPPLKDRRGNVAKMARQMYAQNANGDSTLRNLFQYLSTEFARSPAVLREAGPSLGERAAAVVAQVLIAHPETRQGEMSNDKETLEELDALIEPAKALANAFSKPSGFGTIRMASVISTFNIQYDTVEWDDIERERFRDDNSTNPSVYR